MSKKIGTESYNELLTRGATVPRYKGEIVSFSVGREYDVISPQNSDKIKVRCTQNMPTHIIKL